MTKIDIISGFLGAGKTTLIKKLLSEAFQGEKLVLIENEFGEIGIDGGFLKESGILITEMNSGCICCSLIGDFGMALQEVLETYTPDRVIIEPSGVGKLSDVIKAVENVAKNVEIMLNSYTAVVDVKKYKIYMKNFGEFFNNQIESAKSIILSRTQNIEQDKLEACVRELKKQNKNATIVTTPWDEMSGELILVAMEKNNSFEKKLLEEETCEICGSVHSHNQNQEESGHCHDHKSHHDHEDHHHDHEHHHDHKGGHNHEEGHHEHHHAEEVFSSWGIETPHKYSKEELNNILKTLIKTDAYGTILRAKGMVPCLEGGFIYFDLVPEEYEIREGASDVTGRICVIGSKLKEDEIAKLFHV